MWILGESLGDFREKSSRIGKQMIGQQNPPNAIYIVHPFLF